MSLCFLSRRSSLLFSLFFSLSSFSPSSFSRFFFSLLRVQFIPALLHFSTIHPSAPLLIVDDDFLYPSDFVALFHHHAQLLPDHALATRGWNVPHSLKWKDSGTIFGINLPVESNPLPVDVLTGCGAYLVRPRMFNLTGKFALTDYESAPRAAFFVDDIWISGHLAAQKVARVVLPSKTRHMTMLFQGWEARTGLIHTDNEGGATNDAVLRYFARYWTYED